MARMKKTDVSDLFEKGFSLNENKERTFGSEKEVIFCSPGGEMMNFYPFLKNFPENFLVKDCDGPRKDIITVISAPGFGDITTDAGSAEFVSPPASNLKDVAEWWSRVVKTVDEVLPNVCKLAFGNQPITYAEREYAWKFWAPKLRYGAMKEASFGIPGHSALSASYQTTVSLKTNEAIKVYNTLSMAAGLFVAIFNNASIYNGKPNGCMAWREKIWGDFARLECGGNKEFSDRVGPLNFEDFEDLADYLYKKRVLFYRGIDGQWVVPFKSFALLSEEKSYEEMVEILKWHIGSLWPVGRLRFEQGLFEFRPCCPQPGKEALAVDAAILGAVENHRALSLFLSDFGDFEFWCRFYHESCVKGLKAEVDGVCASDLAGEFVNIIYSALIERGKGEEVYFDETMERIAVDRPWTWGMKAIKAWEKGGFPELAKIMTLN